MGGRPPMLAPYECSARWNEENEADCHGDSTEGWGSAYGAVGSRSGPRLACCKGERASAVEDQLIPTHEQPAAVRRGEHDARCDGHRVSISTTFLELLCID